MITCHSSLCFGRHFFVLMALSLLSIEAIRAVEPIQLEVNPATVIQKDFPGLGAVYQGFNSMPEQTVRGFDDTDRRREFERVKSMGLKLARTWYRPDYSCPRGLQGEFDFDTPRMKAFEAWLTEMKKQGITVALQAGWGFPHDTFFGHENLDIERDPARYAEWVSASVRYLVVHRGFDNIKYLVLLTEPITTPWGPSGDAPDGKPPKGMTMWEYYVKVVLAIQDRMVKEGTRSLVKFTAPNNPYGMPGEKNDDILRVAVRDLDSVIDVYSAHNYLKTTDGYASWFKMNSAMMADVKATGKPLWLDEYNVGSNWEGHFRDKPDHGNYLAQVVAASLNSGQQTSLLWALFDQQYIPPRSSNTGSDSFFHGVLRWGLAKWSRDIIDHPEEPYPAYYAWAMMCRYLGGGEAKVLATKSSDHLFLSAVRQHDGKLTLLVINGSKKPANFVIHSTSAIKGTLHRHLYDPATIAVSAEATIPPADKSFAHPGDHLGDSLPPLGVAVYTELE